MNGNADLYLHTSKIKKWDLCAAHALLNSLDGNMTNLKGDLIDYSSSNETVDGLIASLHDFKYYLKKVQNRNF